MPISDDRQDARERLQRGSYRNADGCILYNSDGTPDGKLGKPHMFWYKGEHLFPMCVAWGLKVGFDPRKVQMLPTTCKLFLCCNVDHRPPTVHLSPDFVDRLAAVWNKNRSITHEQIVEVFNTKQPQPVVCEEVAAPKKAVAPRKQKNQRCADLGEVMEFLDSVKPEASAKAPELRKVAGARGHGKWLYITESHLLLWRHKHGLV